VEEAVRELLLDGSDKGDHADVVDLGKRFSEGVGDKVHVLFVKLPLLPGV